MPLPAQILAILAVASMFLSMGAAYLAAPKLNAFLKRRTPSVHVPAFDLGDHRGTNRLISRLWRVEVPRDRPRLRRLVLAHRACLIASPLLMLATMAATALLPRDEMSVGRQYPGAPPPTVVTVSGDMEPAP